MCRITGITPVVDEVRKLKLSGHMRRSRLPVGAVFEGMMGGREGEKDFLIGQTHLICVRTSITDQHGETPVRGPRHWRAADAADDKRGAAGTA